MSIKTNTKLLNPECIQKISKDLDITIVNQKSTVRLVVYNWLDNDDLYIPFDYSINTLGLQRPDKSKFPETTIRFTGELRDEQIEVKNEAIDFLNRKGSIMISSYTGFGKSILGVYLACKTKMKTLVLIPNKVILIKQWEESFYKFTEDASIQIVKTNDTLKPECNIYIMNALLASKKTPSFFKDIGVVIVDESHLIVSKVLSESLKIVCPRYLIGLTATPYRSDGLDILLTLYFGKDIIIRKLDREHIVYQVQTGIEPKIEYDIFGKMIWNSVINHQAYHEGRNDLIINIISKFKTRVFLVLCKRVEQAKYLVKKLRDINENVTSLIGSEKKYDVDARVLIGMVQKCSVGFDHVKVDALILAGDVEEYFIQYLGRVFRIKGTIPVIFDIVDNNFTLKKHWTTRKDVYIQHGGIIKSFNKEFPQFMAK